MTCVYRNVYCFVLTNWGKHQGVFKKVLDVFKIALVMVCYVKGCGQLVRWSISQLVSYSFVAMKILKKILIQIHQYVKDIVRF